MNQDLIRMVDLPTSELRVDTSSDDGTIGVMHGYAAVFDTPTVIDSWEGRFNERIARGAFVRSLAENGSRVRVLFNHGLDPSVGDKPLGKPRAMREDAKGLYVEVPLDDTSYNRDLVASLRSGALDGQSFRFTVGLDDWQPAEKGGLRTRTLREIRLFEFGPVTFPAYEATSAGVRTRAAFQAWRASPAPSAAKPAWALASTRQDLQELLRP